MIKVYKVVVIRERASVCPIKDKLHPFFNYWTAISLMKEYIEANDEGVDFILADRGIFDSYVWVNLLKKKDDNKIASEFLKLVNQKFIISNYYKTFYFYSDMSIIMKREYDRQVNKHSGRIMNSSTLNGYSNSFGEVENILLSWCSIKKIDTSNLTIPQTILKICKELDKTLTK